MILPNLKGITARWQNITRFIKCLLFVDIKFHLMVNTKLDCSALESFQGCKRRFGSKHWKFAQMS